MNNTFNIQRFGLLLKRQWLEFGKIYLISLVVVIGVDVAFYIFNLYPFTGFSSQTLEFRTPLFVLFGLLFITAIASTYFAHLGQKPKAIIDLMIPASTFEKFLGGILFTALLSTISFILIFYLTDLAFVSYMRSVFQDTEISQTAPSVKENLAYFFVYQSERSHLLQPFYIAPLLMTSIFLLGSVYFNKFHYIKTAISVMIFCGIWAAIIAKSGKLLFDNKVRTNEVSMSMERYSLEFWSAVLLVVLTVIFWAITYVRLKEKEV
jgi:hypothetical protein